MRRVAGADAMAAVEANLGLSPGEAFALVTASALEMDVEADE
jgi:hypothetical protein